MRILLIKTHRLGDVLQILPLLRALRLAYPDAHIDMVVAAKYAILLDGVRDPSRVLAYRAEPSQPPAAAIDGPLLRVEGAEALLRLLLEKPYDLVINLSPDTQMRLLASEIPTQRRVGTFAQGERSLRYGEMALYLASTVMFRSLISLNLCDAFRLNVGPLPVPAGPFLTAGPADALMARLGLDPARPLVCIQPASADPFRCWAAENYAAVAKQLHEQKIQVAVLGSNAERALAEAICKPSQATFAAGLDLLELRILLKQARFLLSNDTGPMHLAAMLGTPVMALCFGISSPMDTGPALVGAQALMAPLDCAPCARPEACTLDLACRTAVTPADVLALMMGKTPASALAYQAIQTPKALRLKPLRPLHASEATRQFLAENWLRLWLPEACQPIKATPEAQKAIDALSRRARGILKGAPLSDIPFLPELARVLPTLIAVCPETKQDTASLLRRFLSHLQTF